ncbi:DUF1653 domain-containing protein [Candidatus Woesearchaeota archaeon]|nr:DUF1653 domain-containing protein [Candidatus Woesearchaeota archaeon]
MSSSPLKLGIYQHAKNKKLYSVLGIAELGSVTSDSLSIATAKYSEDPSLELCVWLEDGRVVLDHQGLLPKEFDTSIPYVLYQAHYVSEEMGDRVLWARPLPMFIEEIEYEGKKTPRFILRYSIE